ncbi:MAG: response regulator [Deltaproteobacteria bacterium]|nr:response regulator [Deltaproteobacteria bacterium]
MSRSHPILLIVDDEVQILAALRRSLRKEGYRIITAESTVRALELLAEYPVDLVLSDHKMPGMSGVELLAEARRLRPAAVRILITGWTEAVPKDEMESVGIEAMIPKPWDDAQLKDCLRRALGERAV